jgi:NADPH-dependent 2,4-dienoyl-CoA reductase/sulfur reductase-like enzyme
MHVHVPYLLGHVSTAFLPTPHFPRPLLFLPRESSIFFLTQVPSLCSRLHYTRLRATYLFTDTTVMAVTNEGLPESKVDVLIVGAGPAGLMMAEWMAKCGVNARIVDKRGTKVR